MFCCMGAPLMYRIAGELLSFEDRADRGAEQQIGGDWRVGIAAVAGEAFDEVPEIVAREAVGEYPTRRDDARSNFRLKI